MPQPNGLQLAWQVMHCDRWSFARHCTPNLAVSPYARKKIRTWLRARSGRQNSVGNLRSQTNRVSINASKLLEEHRLAFHHRQGRRRVATICS